MSDNRHEPLLSICIPSYNRPEAIVRLLSSIDANPDDVEIVICEDHAPRREQVRLTIQQFKKNSKYLIRYYENEKNYGFDKNIRELIIHACSTFVMFMGDDDYFLTGQLDKFINFLKKHSDFGYVLRSYVVIHNNNVIEPFRYFSSQTYFEKGLKTYVKLFKRSVSISGFTFRRACGMDFLTDRFDGTLLFQIYLMAEITLRYPSVYCDIPITVATPSCKEDMPQFGSAEAEKGRYDPGSITIRNSLNFMKGFFEISDYMDRTYHFDSTSLIRKDLSKNSYPILSIQRRHGLKRFLQYVHLLNKEIHLNTTIYYYLYIIGLIVFGEKFCDRLIIIIKKILGHTPKL